MGSRLIFFCLCEKISEYIEDPTLKGHTHTHCRYRALHLERGSPGSVAHGPVLVPRR
nr:MAG TPA: hypothetical protein [Caudoviricetes sp.]